VTGGYADIQGLKGEDKIISNNDRKNCCGDQKENYTDRSFCSNRKKPPSPSIQFSLGAENIMKIIRPVFNKRKRKSYELKSQSPQWKEKN